MIVFDLGCTNGHKFEGWFGSSDDFENQREVGLLECPICGTTQVEKLLSTFAIKSQRPTNPSEVDPGRALAELCRFLKDNFDDVGSQFAQEALKIHYGVTEKRNIRGVSTVDEEEMLSREGVKFAKIPMPRISDAASSGFISDNQDWDEEDEE
ncbi:MAG: DUF1178 family protein [Deltaproteobacteria bacterium]|nr:DUF1178 family protein [Deltaproteobacteria bacterium]